MHNIMIESSFPCMHNPWLTMITNYIPDCWGCWLQQVFNNQHPLQPTTLRKRSNTSQWWRPPTNHSSHHAKRSLRLLPRRQDLYLDETIDFLWNKFDVCVSIFTISQAFALMGNHWRWLCRPQRKEMQTCGTETFTTSRSFISFGLRGGVGMW